MDTLFFYLSKLAWALLSPSNLLWLFILFGVSLLIFNRLFWAKLVLLPTALLGGIITAYPIGDFLMQPLEKRFPIVQTLPEQIDGIIVLGGGEDLKRALSWPNNPLGNEMGLGGDRYLAARYLATQYPHAPVIFSGGSGSLKLQNSGKEGLMAQQTLAILGIQPPRLIIESASRNTAENIKNTRPLLPKATGHYLLVTSAFHMPRAVGVARQQHLKVIPFPVDFRSNADALRQLDFDFFDHLKSLEFAWKEWIGLTVYYAMGKTNEWFPNTDTYEPNRSNESELGNKPSS